MEQVNKYLTEAMGKKYTPATSFKVENSPWKWFGELWDWAIKQEWWEDFERNLGLPKHWVPKKIINPEAFAIAIYNYLKERE
jgi:hypothetical protein